MVHDPSTQRIVFDNEGVQEAWDDLFTLVNGEFLTTKGRVLSCKYSALESLASGETDKETIADLIEYCVEWEFWEMAEGFKAALEAVRVMEVMDIVNNGNIQSATGDNELSEV